jgi:hypothetical protein
MKEFPKSLNVKYKDRFPEIHLNRMKCYLRKSLYEHIISHEEKDYFSLDEFNSKFNCKMEITQNILSQLIPELQKLGWNCTLSFGNTGLFIYNENKPPTCWE